MKKLKLEHRFAELIIQGKVKSTWRLFDDKDLSIGDEVELIDKVQSDRPGTWRTIGVAHINKIVEKRLGDVDQTDMDNHSRYDSPETAVKAFRRYYGDDVTAATPVKMIHFDFTPSVSTKLDSKQDDDLQASVKIFADGGSRGNPGPSASGYVILDMEDNVLADRGVYLGLTTNNQAEYQALRLALEEAGKMHVHSVDVYMDSLLVINQMKGIFKVKNRELWPVHDAARQLANSFQHITFTQVPRELNKLADAAVNRALDQELGLSS